MYKSGITWVKVMCVATKVAILVHKMTDRGIFCQKIHLTCNTFGTTVAAEKLSGTSCRVESSWIPTFNKIVKIGLSS